MDNIQRQRDYNLEIGLIDSYRAADLITDKQANSWKRSVKRNIGKHYYEQLTNDIKQPNKYQPISIGWLLNSDLPPRIARLIYLVNWIGGKLTPKLREEARTLRKKYPKLVHNLLRHPEIAFEPTGPGLSLS